MAELVDALDSKSGFRKGVQVRFLFWAQITAGHSTGSFFGYNIGTTKPFNITAVIILV